MNNEQLEKRFRTDIKSAQGVIAMATVLSLIYIVRFLFAKNFDFYFCTAVTEFFLKAAQFSPDFNGSIPNAVSIGLIVFYLAACFAVVFLTQKKPERLWLALSIYSFDTVFMLWVKLSGFFGAFQSSDFIDIIFHLFVLAFLVVGIVGNKKLEKLLKK